MPVYEYCCNACNIQFELRQKFSDPPADLCPKCGGTARKMVSAVSFSLKGGGWYGDGYGTKTESAKSEGDTTAGAEAAKEGASTDAAPIPAPVETAQSTSTQASTPTRVETKSTADVTPTPTKGKAELKSPTSDVVS